MSYEPRLAMLDDMERLRARLPHQMEFRMNQYTFDKLKRVCSADIPDPGLAGISSLRGTPIRIYEFMYDNKVGVATFDANGKGVSYEVIDAFTTIT